MRERRGLTADFGKNVTLPYGFSRGGVSPICRSWGREVTIFLIFQDWEMLRFVNQVSELE